MSRRDITTIPLSRKTVRELNRLKSELSAMLGKDLSWDEFMQRFVEDVVGRGIEDLAERLALLLRVMGRVIDEKVIEEYSCEPGMYKDYGVYTEHELCFNSLKIHVRVDGLTNTASIKKVEIDA